MQRAPWGSPRRHPRTPPSLAAASPSPDHPATSPASSWSHGPLFDLSPEPELGMGLPAPSSPEAALAALGGGADADADSGSESGGEDLSGFLAELKSRYGLLDPQVAAPAVPAAEQPLADALDSVPAHVWLRTQEQQPQADGQEPQPQPQPDQEEGLLDAELDAELSVLEELQRQLSPQPQGQAVVPPLEAEAASPAAGTPAEVLASQPPMGSAAPAAGPNSTSGLPSPAAPAGKLPWASLHTLLVQRGFPGLLPGNSAPDGLVPAQPDPAALFQALQSLLAEQARAAAHQLRLGETAAGAARREGALVSSFTAAAKQRDAEVARWKRLALENAQAARDAHLTSVDAGASREQLAADARKLQTAVSRLQAALHSKEVEVGRIKALMEAQRDREERQQRANSDALARLRQAHAAARAADTPGSAAALLKAASRDMKPAHLVRIFEAERANLQEQAAVAAAEACAAQAQLERAREALHAAGLPCDQHEEIEGQARAAARQAAAAQAHAAQLQEEAAQLRAELAERPTLAQLESVQRQAAIMERQLAKAAADKAAAEAKEARRQGARPQQLSTREMIQRDRNLQRLGLQSVEELPKPVLVELLQDACALLECRTPLDLCAALRPVQDLAALVPRLERFAGDVCAAVFQRGLAHVPKALRQDNPADVPAILSAWVAELGELVETRGMLRGVLRHLASRCSLTPADPPPTVGQVVPLVASLVELEREVWHSREVIRAAEGVLLAHPDVLVNRIVGQFQRLFGCRGLEGVLPAMNKLYLSHTEAQTFLASLRAALGLDASASLEACANRLEQVLADRREGLATMLPARETPAVVPPPPGAQAVVVEVPQRARQELQEAAAVAVERMAAKRRWPQVQIYVRAGAGRGQGAGDGESHG